MAEWTAVGVSGFALAVSGITAWLTFFRSGELRMTQPTVVFFGPEAHRSNNDSPRFRVFVRTLLYSTSGRGQTIESMYVKVLYKESSLNFPIWVYGDDRLALGSGLHVGADGLVCNHYFLLPKDHAAFKLRGGQYTVGVYAKRVSDRKPRELACIVLTIPDAQVTELEQEDAGIYFHWGPDLQAYHTNVEIRTPTEIRIAV